MKSLLRKVLEKAQEEGHTVNFHSQLSSDGYAHLSIINEYYRDIASSSYDQDNWEETMEEYLKYDIEVDKVTRINRLNTSIAHTKTQLDTYNRELKEMGYKQVTEIDGFSTKTRVYGIKDDECEECE